MQYVMLIYDAEERWAAMPEEEQMRVIGRHQATVEKATADGAYLGGNRLVDTHAATSVRQRNGKITVSDGPFAETKEQLGGYYLLDCKDLDQAIGYANMLQYEGMGSVEIRPIFEM
ncbi:MAG: YciI family protein [Pseudomonadota bacterium]